MGLLFIIGGAEDLDTTAVAGQGFLRYSRAWVHDGDHAVLHTPQPRLGPAVLVEVERYSAEVGGEGQEDAF